MTAPGRRAATLVALGTCMVTFAFAGGCSDDGTAAGADVGASLADGAEGGDSGITAETGVGSDGVADATGEVVFDVAGPADIGSDSLLDVAVDVVADVAVVDEDTAPPPPVGACASDDDCQVYEDGDLCNGVLTCDLALDPPACRLVPGSVVTCDKSADSLCASATCQPADGTCALQPTNDGAFCDDGQPCTEAACSGGQCVAADFSKCPCKSTADCAAQEDGDVCNGSFYCDKSVYPYVCKVTPSTVVVCPTQVEACAAMECVPATGVCEMVPVADQAPCDDGDPATVGDVCDAGTCTPGTDTSICGSDADCEAWEDGDLCNGVLFCNKVTAHCELNPKTVVSCPSVADTACWKNLCQPLTGTCALTPVKPGTACDDGDACTVDDICVGGGCQPGTNTCLCQGDADCADKDDGDLCNGVRFCNQQTKTCQLNPATVVVCPSVDDTACAHNACENLKDPTGLATDTTCTMAPANEGGACDDGDACTQGTVCDGGACGGGKAICQCATDAGCLAWDDGDLCNGVAFCDHSTDPPSCQPDPSSVVNCATVDDTDCRKNLCQPQTGKCAMSLIDAGTPCDDGNTCTKNDYCLFGACSAGTDTCACQKDADCADQEDGDVCNGTLYCDKSGDEPVCKLNTNTAIVCPQNTGSVCLKKVCHPVTGQCLEQPDHDGDACDDSNPCTGGTHCAAGGCVGEVLSCEDGNGCTTDFCHPVEGCQHKAKVCDDGNSCTADGCDSQTGVCSVATEPLDGAICNADQNGCTINDVCVAGLCKAGKLAICPLETSACDLAICASTGATSFACTKTAIGDGAPCDDGVACTVGDACKSGACAPGEAAMIYVDALAPPAAASATVDGRLTAAASLAEGAWVVGGTRLVAGLPGGVTESGWWVARLDEGGALAWQAVLASAAGADSAAVAGVAPASNGGVLVGGHAWFGGERDFALARLGAGGALVWHKSVGVAGADEAARAMIGLPGGSVLIAGSRNAGDDRDGWLVEVSETGLVASAKAVGLGARAESLGALAITNEGGTAAGGWHAEGEGTVGWLVVRDPAGTTLWQRSLVFTDAARLVGLVTLADGTLVATGEVDDGGNLQASLVAWTATGTPLWRRSYKGARVPTALVGRAGDRPVIAGWSSAGPGQRDLWIGSFDVWGNATWDVAAGDSADDRAHAVAVDPSGGVLAVGSTRLGGHEVGLIARADAWGHLSCAGAGGCADATLASCDDGTLCTRDRCDGKMGCVAEVVPGMTCPSPDGCSATGVCAAGTCQSSANQRLFVHTEDAPKGAILGHAHRASGTGGLRASRVVDGKLEVQRYDIYAKPVETKSFAVAGVAELGGSFVDLADGGVVTSWRDAAGQVGLARLASDGSEVWKTTLYTPVDLAVSACAWNVVKPPGNLAEVELASDGNSVRATFLAETPGWAHLCKVLGGGANAYVIKHCLEARRVNLADGAVVGSGSHCGGNTNAYPSYGELRVLYGSKLWQNGIRLLGEASGGGFLVGGKAMEVVSFDVYLNGAKDGAYFARVAENGALQWERVSHFTGATSDLYALAPTPGGYLGVVQVNPGGAAHSEIVRFNGGGILLWQQSLAAQAVAWATPMTLPGGGFALAGRATGNAGQQPWLSVWDASRALVWQHFVAAGDGDALVGARWLDDGGVLFGGRFVGTANEQLFFARTDIWGHATCAEAGTCSAKSADACGDGSWCTVDICDGESGDCQHLPASGSPCNDGDACTSSDVCKAGSCAGAPISGCK